MSSTTFMWYYFLGIDKMIGYIISFVLETNLGFLFLAILHLVKQEDKYLKKIRNKGGKN